MFTRTRRPSESDLCACGNPKAIAANRCRECYMLPTKDIPKSPDKSYRLIPLTKGQVAMVDPCDFDRLIKYNWIAQWNKCTNSFYARSKTFGMMHTFILGAKVVDHQNHDTLDNRRKNIRECTRSQNSQNKKRYKNNSSGITGVYFHSRDRQWNAYINSNGKRTYLGHFETKDEAIEARKVATQKHHGEFAFGSH